MGGKAGMERTAIKVKATDMEKLRWRLLSAALLAAVLLLTGCEHGEGTVVVEDDDPSACATGLVEGTAFYPFYEGDPEPVYYADENFDIIVALYDELDNPVADVVTGPAGFYEFDGLPPGYYYIAAYAETYVEREDLFDIYVAQTPLFRVGECDWIDEKNLFLEYSHSES